MRALCPRRSPRWWCCPAGSFPSPWGCSGFPPPLKELPCPGRRGAGRAEREGRSLTAWVRAAAGGRACPSGPGRGELGALSEAGAAGPSERVGRRAVERPGLMTRFLPSLAGVCVWSPQQRRRLRAARGERGEGRKQAGERRGLHAPQWHSNTVPGRSPRGPSSCPAVVHCIERVVCVEQPRGGRLGAGLSGGSAEPLRCRGALGAAASELRCLLRPCRLARGQHCLPNKLPVPGRTATARPGAVRAEPREGESGLGSPIVRQHEREAVVFRDFAGPYRAGIGGRCWDGRPLASCLGESGVTGSELGLPGDGAVGRYWRP